MRWKPSTGARSRWSSRKSTATLVASSGGARPNTDDMREAPSRTLMEALWEAGARVRAYDPVAAAEAQRLYGNRTDLKIVENSSDALQGADALAIVTEWQEFRSPDFELIKNRLSHPAIFDGRELRLLDAILHLPMCAVELFIQARCRPVLRIQGGDNEARIGTEGRMFGFADHPPLGTPAVEGTAVR